MDRIERQLRIGLSSPDRRHETCDEHQTYEGGIPPACPVQQHQDQWEQQVELLFDRQAPGVKQRRLGGELVEVVDFEIEEVVRQEQRGRNDALPHILDLPRHEHERGDQQRHQHSQAKRRQDTSRSPLVEMKYAETAFAFEPLDDDAGDQEPADHEEDVDTVEARLELGQAGMEQDHWNDSDRAQPVDFRAVFQRLAFHCRPSPEIGTLPRNFGAL